MKPFGINNLGNTCYFNALFQALISADKFVEYMIKYGKSNSLMRLLMLNFNYQYYEWLIRKCVKTIGSQEDSDEYFLKLIDNFPADVQRLFKITTKIELKCDSCTFADIKTETNYQYFLINENVNIQETFYPCKCGGKIKSIVSIIYLPEILYFVMQLRIQMPEKLHFTRENKKVTYSLVAVVIHHGSQNSGHYIAQCAREGKIYNFNDNSVTEIGKFDTLAQKRILLYQLVSE